MGLQRTHAVVIGRRPLGEADRLATFYTREFGRLTGVAKGARRPRSRFGSALELFSQGELLFFETERSQLVRVDHFDLERPFVSVREQLDRLGQGAWVVECLARLTAERDPHRALYGLLLRTLGALENLPRPERAALAFALRAIDLLGHRLRLDRCVGCGAPADPSPRLDFAAGGLLCGTCARAGTDSVALSGGALAALRRLRTLSWEPLVGAPLSRTVEKEIISLLEGQMTRLMGYPLRTTRFLIQTRRTPVDPTAVR